MPQPPRQFVVQIHSGLGPTHYDLMLEEEQALATWRLGMSPAEMPRGGSIAARKLPDHRKHYLTHEGAVSGGRGEVRILDRGGCETLAVSCDERKLRLQGQLLRGSYVLQRMGGDDWALQRLD